MLAAAALLWSTGGVGIKGVEATATVVVFYRSCISAVTLMLLLRPGPPRTTFRFFGAAASYALCLTTFVIATKWTTAANAIFLQYSGVVWVLILSPLMLREPLRMRDLVAVIVALSGMALFFAGRLQPQGLAGSFVALLSGLFFALIILTLRGLPLEVSEAVVTWGNVLAALIVLPWAIHGLRVSGHTLLVVGYLGVVQIGLAYVLFVRGIQHVKATQASLITMLEPISNPIWVFLLLGERPSRYAMAGGAVVLAAIAWRTLGEGAPSNLAAQEQAERR